ncbi:MAG TPA: hypothetical protein VHX43_11725 [Xanthobacteraceae bacterium]|nr:hypothetical protein [Xanthobacteraceae bacterium]
MTLADAVSLSVAAELLPADAAALPWVPVVAQPQRPKPMANDAAITLNLNACTFRPLLNLAVKRSA